MVLKLKTLIQRATTLGLSLGLVACASLPQASTTMRLGEMAAAPAGYVAFCTADPTECATKSRQVQTLESPNLTASLTVTAAIDDLSGWREQRLSKTALPTPDPEPITNSIVRINIDLAMAELAKSPVAAISPEPGISGPLNLSASLWKTLNQTNTRINGALRQRTDLAVYGVDERWALPLEAGLMAGDCEDFVLEKRHALVAAGVPEAALSIAVVITRQNEIHAVLVIATDKGDYVLDSLDPRVSPWQKTPYIWRERQGAGTASNWFYAKADDRSPDAPDYYSHILLASLR